MNTEIILEKLTKDELIILCKELNIKGYSNKRKDQIIEMIKKIEIKERRKWVEEYNQSLPKYKIFDKEFQEEMNVTIGGICDSEFMEYVYSNIDLYGRIKKIKEQLANKI